MKAHTEALLQKRWEQWRSSPERYSGHPDMREVDAFKAGFRAALNREKALEEALSGSTNYLEGVWNVWYQHDPDEESMLKQIIDDNRALLAGRHHEP